MLSKNQIHCMDNREGLKMLDDNSVDCCITSPPYWGLRDYGVDGQIGLEQTPDEYVEQMVNVFREVKRALKPEGTLWLNLGDSYAGSMKGIGADGQSYAGQKQATNKGSVGIYQDKPPKANEIGLKPKDLVGIPWRVAFALQADGWYLRQEIIWHKPNPMPESVTDRCTKAHEYIFLLSKSQTYYFDHDAIKENALTKPVKRNKHEEGYQADYSKGDRFSKGERVYGADGKRNKRSVWKVATKPFKEAHFATFPEKLIEPCVLAGCPEGGTVLDPFMGAGTTAVVAWKNNRNYLGFELNPEYVLIATKRLEKTTQQVSLI